RGALRSAAPDEEIARIWKLAMWGKKAGSGLADPSCLQPDRPMSALGG
ncbi:GTP 3',8-cyclase MoaA, partial [Streptomyces sp. DT9]